MSTYAIGDIQGCYIELQQLLQSINFDPTVDHLWLVGDLINRGPDNLQTIEFIMATPNVEIVLGNHDLHFLALATTTRSASSDDTLNDLLSSPRLPEIIDWMRRLPLIHHSDEFNCTMVHAGIPSIWHIDQAIGYAREVENVLRSQSYTDFFKHMYGDLPVVWSDGLQGWDRLRLITNYLTRLRYCTRDGKIELAHKTDKVPHGFSHWFSFPRPDDGIILFGHWAAIEGITHKPTMIALDTGCVWGRKLTAYRLEDQQFFSVSAQDD